MSLSEFDCGCEDCVDRIIAREEEVSWNSQYNRWNSAKEREIALLEYEKNKKPEEEEVIPVMDMLNRWERFQEKIKTLLESEKMRKLD